MRAEKTHLFYGWVIVAVAFVSAGFTSGIGIWSLSVFVIPMTEDLGWSRTAFFTSLTIRALLTGVLSPIVGPWLDTRHGPRLLAFGSAIALGASLVGVKFVDEAWQFWLIFGVIGAFSQAGSGMVVTHSIVPKWFIRKRGRALGIATMGTGLGALLFPISVSALVNTVGWRDAWLVLGLACVALLAPLSLLVRTRPEDMGLLPDGEPATQAAAKPNTSPSVEQSLTRHQAIRTSTFWLLVASFSLVGFGIVGFQTNWVPYLLESGFSSAQAASSIAIYGALSGLSRPLWGYMGERVPARYLMATVTTLTAASILMFLGVRTIPLLVSFMTIAGLVMGGYIIVQSLITANYFGRAYLGSVGSAMRPFFTLSFALSPLLVGALYDLQGNYTLAFLVAMAAWLVAGAIVLMARPPMRAEP